MKMLEAVAATGVLDEDCTDMEEVLREFEKAREEYRKKLLAERAEEAFQRLVTPEKYARFIRERDELDGQYGPRNPSGWAMNEDDIPVYLSLGKRYTNRLVEYVLNVYPVAMVKAGKIPHWYNAKLDADLEAFITPVGWMPFHTVLTKLEEAAKVLAQIGSRPNEERYVAIAAWGRSGRRPLTEEEQIDRINRGNGLRIRI